MSDYEKLTRPKSLEPMDAWLDMDSFSVPWQCDAVRYIQRLEEVAKAVQEWRSAFDLDQMDDLPPEMPKTGRLRDAESALRSALAKLEERGS